MHSKFLCKGYQDAYMFFKSIADMKSLLPQLHIFMAIKIIMNCCVQLPEQLYSSYTNFWHQRPYTKPPLYNYRTLPHKLNNGCNGIWKMKNLHQCDKFISTFVLPSMRILPFNNTQMMKTQRTWIQYFATFHS